MLFLFLVLFSFQTFSTDLNRLKYSECAFSLSFSFLISDQLMAVFNKAVILLGLAVYQMTITISALRVLLVISYLISSAPS